MPAASARGVGACAAACVLLATLVFGAPRVAGAAAGLTLITEPAAGPAPLDRLLGSAHRSLDLVMYELEDPRAEAILAADAHRGVRVRVLLDEAYVGRYNRPAMAYLRAHGVEVRWAPSRFDLTHEKAAVIDGRVGLVMTLNLTSRYYASTRDFAVVDRQPGDVAAIESTFDSDWAAAVTTGAGAGAPAAPMGLDLVWSPGASRTVLGLIDSARHELLVEDEEMRDPDVIVALASAARRGVHVEVVMNADSQWDAAFAELSSAGVAVRVYPYSYSGLYIHAKVIVVDPGRPGARVMVGSQNFSVASLVYNRELGLVTSAAPVVDGVASVVRADFAGGRPWR